jgi:succinate dehydrogenase/fumarate reductase cytochrome b subunit
MSGRNGNSFKYNCEFTGIAGLLLLITNVQELTWCIETLEVYNRVSATLAAAFGSLPLAAKVAAKFATAFQLTFHGLNGVGHLLWDTGRRFEKKQIVA